MTHEDMQELAVGFAFHALEPDEERELLAHLPTCAECTQLVTDSYEVAAVLADDPTYPDADAGLTSEQLAGELAGSGLRDRIVAAAAAEPRPDSAGRVPTEQIAASAKLHAPRTHTVARGTSPASRRRLARAMIRTRVAVGALAAAVAVAVAVPVTLAVSGGGSGGAGTSLAQALLQPDARELTLTGSSGANAKAVVSAKGVVFLAEGLRPNDTSNETYVLWAGDRSGVRPVATFDAAAGKVVQVASTTLPISPASVSTVAVSVEPGRRAPAAPTDVVLAGKPA